MIFRLSLVCHIVLYTYQVSVNARTYQEPMVGPCRGPGGVNDKVNSRSAKEYARQMCEDACDNIAEDKCVGYAYCQGCNGGECVLYGPGLDGTCTDSSATNPIACETSGRCYSSDNTTKLTEDACGVCAESTATSKSACDSVGSEWVVDQWISAGAIWEDAEDPWTGDSHYSTVIVNSTQEVDSRYLCMDIDPEDHLATCSGSTATNSSMGCSALFIGLAENDRVVDKCPEECEFTAAHSVPKTSPPHDVDIKIPGWNPALSGACRGGPTHTDKVNGKYSNSAGANGGTLTQEECATACVYEDECIGYAHSTDWCIVYGATIHENVDDLWAGDLHEAVDISGTKANPSYLCVTGPPRATASESTSSSGERFHLVVTIHLVLLSVLVSYLSL